MDQDQMRTAKHDLEKAATAALRKLVDEFEKRTSAAIKNVTVTVGHNMVGGGLRNLPETRALWLVVRTELEGVESL